MIEYTVKNESEEDISDLATHVDEYFPYAKKTLGFDKPITIIFKSDLENAGKILGRTGQYDPANFSMTIFITKRHPKDILRSFSHELVHHAQNCRGEFEGESEVGEQGYAQNNPHLRNIEKDAYLEGNLCFRDWEDFIKFGSSVQVSLGENIKKRRNKTLYEKLFKTFTKEVQNESK